MPHEFEPESLTGPLEGVEVLNQQIHFRNMAHSDSFSVEDDSSGTSSMAATDGGSGSAPWARAKRADRSTVWTNGMLKSETARARSLCRA